MAILFLGYILKMPLNTVFVHVSIAGGDSFFGIPTPRVGRFCLGNRFNRRWRFFFWDTLQLVSTMGYCLVFQSQVAILFLGYKNNRCQEFLFHNVSIAGGDSFFGVLPSG